MYPYNPLLIEFCLVEEGWKDQLIKDPGMIAREVDPVKRKALKLLRHKLIVGRKVSKAMAKGPDYYVSYLPSGTKVKHTIIPGEDIVHKWRRLPRPWARSKEWNDKSIVTKAIGRPHEGTFGKYRRELIPSEWTKDIKKNDAEMSGDLMRKITHREPGDFLVNWKKKRPGSGAYW